ncbi:hypothetical protein EDD22DRAFT_955352 [Suillus occidentalis]|nr:hypothetical protein EDD22DRAFT_955352 [Suillus occidentalis]
MDSDWDIIRECLKFRPELRPSADKAFFCFLHQDSFSPFDNLPDNAQGGFRRPPPHHDSDDPDIIDRMSTPPHPDRELMNVMMDSQTQRSSSSSLNTGSPSPPPGLGTGPKCFIAGRRFTVQQTWWVGDDNRLFQAIGRLFSKGRQFAFISDVPYMTQVCCDIGMNGIPSQTRGDDDKVSCWKVLQFGPGKRQEVVHLPSRGRTGDPDLVFCTLNEMKNGFEANETSVGAASDFIQNGPDYEWVPSVRPGISVENKVPHEVLFALGQTFGTSSLQMNKKCKQQQRPTEARIHSLHSPYRATREFTGSIYVHAFQTASATREHVSKFDMDLSIQWWTIAGSQYDFSDPDFLANRIAEENGCEVSQLSPTTYWFVYQGGGRLRVKIGRSRKDIERYKHQLSLDA